MAAFSSLRVRLMLLVVLAMIPALGFILYTDIEQRRIAGADIEEDALRVTRLASATQERFIEGAHQLLLALSHLPEVREGAPERCHEVLSELLEQYPLYANFGVTDADGSIFCSALAIEQPVPAGDRAWFRGAKETRDFTVGEYQIGRITNKATVNFAYPLIDAEKRFRGVIFAALDLNWVKQLIASAKLAPGASIMIVDTNGVVLARSPDHEKWFGKQLPDAPLAEVLSVSQGKEGTTEFTSVDGTRRLYSYTALAGSNGKAGAYVIVGIPRKVAYAEAHRMLRRNLVLLGAVFLVALAAAWFLSDAFVLKRVKSIVRTTEQLSAGDLTARTGLSHDAGELGQLATAFDAMAESLEMRVAERRNAERALLDSERRFRDLFEFSPDPIFVETMEGKVIDVNPAACRLHGLKREELIGKRVGDLVPPSIRDEATRMFPEWVKGSIVSLESLSLRNDGSVVPVEIRASRIDFEGQPAMLFHVRDISIRKRSEAALKRARDELESRVIERTAELARANEVLKKRADEISDLYNNAPCGYHSLNGEGVFVQVNDTELAWLGYTREEVIGKKRFSDFMTSEGHETFAATFELFKQQGWIKDLEFTLVRKDGSTLDVLLNATAIKDEAGHFVMSRSTTVDVTDRRKTEARLRRLHHFLDSIVENIPNMIFVKGAQDLRFVRLNKAGEELLGLSREDLVGKADADLFPLAEAAAFTARDRAVIESGKLMDIPEEEILARGQVRVLHTKKIPIFGDDGQPRYLLGISEDITERIAAGKELEKTAAELKRSNEELEQFAYVASHDLQEPLRMVASYTQLLERRYKDKLDADAHEFIAFAVDGAKRMQRFINDLLEYSRVGTRGRPFEPVDMATVIAQVRHNLALAIEEKSAALTNDSMPTVSGDAVQLTQLFQNLVSNAIKFRRDEPPRVHISARREGDTWLFAVIDNGIGIEPQFFDRIFVIFQRLHTRDQFEGTGIGLSICKKIVERHGGRIWIESNPGEGSTFSFTIPDKHEA